MEWIDLITAICGMISVGLPLVIALYKAIKTAITEKNYTKILEILKDGAVEAEKLFKTGSEKRDYVLNLIKVACDNLKVKYDETKFDTELTKLIDATKAINSK